MSSEPRLPSGLDLPLTLELSIFATQYEIPALLNQLLDHLTTLFAAKSPALWTPTLLDRVYTEVPDNCLLREFIPWTLSNLIPTPSLFEARNTKTSLDIWRPVFESHPALGYDYFRAKQSDWVLSDGYRTMRHGCRFHRHPRSVSPAPSTEDSFLFGDDSRCSHMSTEPFLDMVSTPTQSEAIIVEGKPPKNQNRKAKHRSKVLHSPLYDPVEFSPTEQLEAPIHEPVAVEEAIEEAPYEEHAGELEVE